MGRFLISIIFTFTILVISGCSSRKSDVDANINIKGELLYSPDKTPLRQAVIYRRSDGKAFLTDNSGRFNVEAHRGDSLIFSFVGTISRTVAISECDTSMIVLLDPYIPGNDEYIYNERLFGKYVQKNDGSTLTITKADEGRYNVLINLFRLTQIDDGIGILTNGKLIFTGTDASGEPISGEIIVNEDSAILKITYSTWENLPKGSTFTFERETNLNMLEQKSYSTTKGITMRIVEPDWIKTSLDSLVIEFRNTRKEEGMTGEFFRIERLSDNGEWKELPLYQKYEDGDIEVIFNAVGWIILPDTTLRMTIKPWFYEREWNPGTYRLAKTFSYPPYPRTIPSDTAYVEFQVK